MPYHLATPQHSWLIAKGPERTLRPFRHAFYGVDDGTRTRDTRNHNPMLYQLNYTHHIGNLRGRGGTSFRRTGTPEACPISKRAGAHLPDKDPSEEGEACFASGVPKAGHHRHSSKG